MTDRDGRPDFDAGQRLELERAGVLRPVLEDGLPLNVLCARPYCGMPFFRWNLTKRYCSGHCRDLEVQRRARERRRARSGR